MATSLAAWLQQRQLATVLGAAVLVAGYLGQSISLQAATALGLMAFIGFRGQRAPNDGFEQRLCEILQTLGLAAFSFRLIPGFTRTIFSEALFLRSDAIAFHPSFNIDKALAASIVLCSHRLPKAFSNTALGSWDAIKSTWGPSLAVIGIMLMPALFSGFVRFDPQFNALFFLWAPHNLLLVAVAEETLYRGCIPSLLQQYLPSPVGSPAFVLMVSSLLFGLSHAQGGPTYVGLSTLAGVGYGWAALRAGGISGSITTHFILNATHFLFFTYPALSRN